MLFGCVSLCILDYVFYILINIVKCVLTLFSVLFPPHLHHHQLTFQRCWERWDNNNLHHKSLHPLRRILGIPAFKGTGIKASGATLLCEYIVHMCLNDYWHFLIDCGATELMFSGGKKGKKNTHGALCMLTRWPQSLWRQRRLTRACGPCQVPCRYHEVSWDFTFVLLPCALSRYPLRRVDI